MQRPLFLVTSFINNWPPNTCFTVEERYQQTLFTLETIYAKCPHAVVCVAEGSRYLFDDDFTQKYPNLYVYYLQANIRGIGKSEGELTILLEFLQSEAYRQLMQSFEINMVFKLSGRYWLNDDFRLLPLLELSSSAFYFKIVRVYQDVNNVAIWNNDRKDACFSTCLFGFTPDQMPRACEAFQHVFQHMQRERWDIENGLYQYFVGRAPHSESRPRFPTVFVPKIGVSGRLSGPGTLIHH